MNIRKTVSFSKNAVNVFFHILTRCNLRCAHCYINPEQHGKNTLSLETIKKWLQILVGQGKSANVIFLGGEPTLHPRLHLAIKTAKKLGYASVTVDTNGYLFNDILNKVQPEEVDYFSFSLDGPDADINDPVRGKGSFETCTSGIVRAVEKGFHTSLIYTVSSENIHALVRMPPLLKRLGVERFFIQVIGIRGNSAKKKQNADDNLQVSRKNWLSVVPDVAEHAASLGITTTYPKVYLDVDEPFQCAALVAENYFVFPNGRVYRCPLCEDFPIHGLCLENDRLSSTKPINENDLFHLAIPEGCVMNKIVQPGNIEYDKNGQPLYRVACCMLKEEVRPDQTSRTRRKTTTDIGS